MAGNDVRAMMGRRPGKGEAAFGHVDLSPKARGELAEIVRQVRQRYEAMRSIPFHPEDSAEDTEVLTGDLTGFDSNYQEKAAWSLERTVKELRAPGLPELLGPTELSEGAWSFYAIRLKDGGHDVVVVRGKSPTYGLGSANKVVTKLIGNELRPVPEPLVGFDYDADLLIVDELVYVVSPSRAERLFVDAEAVKKRAPQTAQRFAKGIAATLTTETAGAVERICSHNATIARRVERLVSDGNLARVEAAKIRTALPDAGLPEDAFGKSGPLQAHTDPMAKILIEVAADLYYQPRFAGPSRRVGSYRNVKK
jgi:hypothetical protein